LNKVFLANIKIGLKQLLSMLLGLLIVTLSYTVLIPIIFEEDFGGKSIIDFFSGVSIMLMIPLAGLTFLTIQSMLTRRMLEFGSTRKAIFISQQIVKIIASILLVSIFFIENYFVQLIYANGSTQIFQVDISVMLFIIIILASTLGEFIGIVSNVLSKFGKTIFIIFSAVYGGIFGITPFVQKYSDKIIEGLSFNLTTALICSTITIILLVISYRIFRRYSINS
jgi:hypothetical protein